MLINNDYKDKQYKLTKCTFPECKKIIKSGARMCSKHIRIFHEAKSRQCNRGLSTEQIIGYAADHIGIKKHTEVYRRKGWEEPHDHTGRTPKHRGAADKKALKYTLRIQRAQEQMKYPKIIYKYYSIFDKTNKKYVKTATNSETLKQAVEAIIRLNYITYSAIENFIRMTLEEQIEILKEDDYEVHRHNIRN